MTEVESVTTTRAARQPAVARTEPTAGQGHPFAAGLVVALVSALAFGSSGAFATTLIESGWSTGAVVTARITGAALLLVVPALVSLRGRWALLRRNAGTVVAYGLVAVAGCQLAYFNAVERLSVGVALLLEYLAPVLIVAWLWARHGRRPSRLTVVGSATALVGLVLVLDVASGARVDAVGVGYGLLAAVGLVVFFILSAREDDALPPLAFAGGGLVVGAATLVGAGVLGVLPMRATTDDVVLAGATAPWWVPVVELVLVAAVIAYVTGIAATRMLGATLASFVGLSEVVLAIVVAWVLVGQAMAPVQLLGGLAILGGVVAVKLGQGTGEATPPPEVPLVAEDEVEDEVGHGADDAAEERAEERLAGSGPSV